MSSFFDEFALFARDLENTLDDYRRECRQPGPIRIDPARVTRQTHKTLDEIAALEASIARPLVDGFRARLRQLQNESVGNDDLHLSIDAECGLLNNYDDIDNQPVEIVNITAEKSLKSIDQHGDDHQAVQIVNAKAENSPIRPRLSLSSQLQIPVMPSISSHSQAIVTAIEGALSSPQKISSDINALAMNSSQNSKETNNENRRHIIGEDDMNKVSGFLRSRITLQDLNRALSLLAIRNDPVTIEFIERDLGFGTQSKALIMVLQQLELLRSTRDHHGATAYAVVL